jgi:hypothetical protein
MLRSLFVHLTIQSCAITVIAQNSAQDCRERYSNELNASPTSSLVHFQVAECF